MDDAGSDGAVVIFGSRQLKCVPFGVGAPPVQKGVRALVDKQAWIWQVRRALRGGISV